jgi:hypothetical protein
MLKIGLGWIEWDIVYLGQQYHLEQLLARREEREEF